MFGYFKVRRHLKELESTDRQLRHNAVEALGEIGSAAGAAIPALIEALKEKDQFFRKGVAKTLGKIGPAARDAVPALIEALDDGETVAEAIGNIGPSAAIAVPALAKVIMNNNTYLEEAVRISFDKIEAKYQPHFQVLISRLMNRYDIDDIARYLGLMSPTGVREYVNYFWEASKKDQFCDSVRAASTRALGKIGHTVNNDVITPLLSALTDPCWSVRMAAADALGKVGVASVVPRIVVLLQSNNKQIRLSAVEALGKIGSAAQTAVPDLINSLNHPESYMREIAGEALSKIGVDKTNTAHIERQIRNLIIQKDKATLSKLWPYTKEVLLADIRTGNDHDINNALIAFMGLSETRGQPLTQDRR